MNKKALKILEFDKIIQMLRAEATSDPAREMIDELLPSSDIDEIKTAQEETDAAVNRIRMKGHFNFGDNRNMDEALIRLNIEASLGSAELLRIGNLLGNVERAKDYAGEMDDCLTGFFTALAPVRELRREIERCIVAEDTIADNASPELLRIRREYKSIIDKMHSQLNGILNANREYLMDPVIAVRDGSYCLPVRIEFKNKVPGIIHDQSSSGSTLFIEPMAVVNLNNSLRELEAKDKQEVAKILMHLSELTIPHISAIKSDIELMTHLDFVFAKASLAGKMNASKPVIGDDGIIDLKDARHPLLAKDKVVPISIRLGDEYDLLVVTGPNTGGKTVSLKTVGLLTLMAQAGLQIPAFQSSRISVFEEVFADIGDEQSIEQSLSTFSGHMKNIVEIVNKADSKSLCLFDELGAGTDPTEGAALAISILSFLHRMQIRTIATTHYSELKVYALSTPGVENAACEFNVNTLRPTYRILIGVPGKSNAFAISKKLGLPQFIIDEAGEHIEKNDAALEDIITKLDRERVRLEREKDKAKEFRKELEKLKSQQKKQGESMDSQKERILREAHEEANRILTQAKETADESIRKINKMVDDAGLTKSLEKERTRLRQGIKETTEGMTFHTDKVDAGDIELLKKMMGGADTRDDKDKSSSKKPQKATRYVGEIKSSTISPEINVIGKNVDEATALLDKYLDDALLSHLPSVRIIHGRGTGALKKGIHAYLRKLSYVKEYGLADFEDGGDAVTIVKF